MEKRLDKLEERLDTIIDKLHEQNVTLARNTESLIIHEKRTDLAEQKLELLQKAYSEHAIKDDLILQSIESKLNPIYKHVSVVGVILKYVLPAIAGIVGFLYKLGIIHP
jgi:vacuolar-type H+-ATPase subunit H